jgi:hypothetical protein
MVETTVGNRTGIGHMKTDGRFGRNYLLGVDGSLVEEGTH